MTAAVEFDRITCTFPGKAGPYTAVKDVTLAVAEGEFVSVVGPTGCGKSTLLNVAAGLLRPSSGALRVLLKLHRGDVGTHAPDFLEPDHDLRPALREK